MACQKGTDIETIDITTNDLIQKYFYFKVGFLEAHF